MTTRHSPCDEPADPVRFTSLIRSELCAMQFQSDVRARSRAPSLAGVQAGPIDVLQYSGLGEQWGGRDQRLIRSDRADYYVICAPISAQLAVRQNGRTAELRRGSYTLVSTGRPFHARIHSEVNGEFFSAVHVRVPGPLLRRRIPDIDDVCGREVRVLPGSGRMMLSLFDLALSEGPYLSAGERTRFGNDLLEMIVDIATVPATSTERRVPRPSAHQRTVECAKAFIASRLSDPDLDPAAVAEHCGVSRRFLHTSFSALSDRSVAQFIRESRLQACHEALTHPRLRGRTIIEIAGDWGFEDPAHFCRLYKASFGRTPREDRASVPAAIAA
jgi:AraC-like DNA-binding protein